MEKNNNNIFVSYLDIKNNCQIYNIASAQINFDNLLFQGGFKQGKYLEVESDED